MATTMFRPKRQTRLCSRLVDGPAILQQAGREAATICPRFPVTLTFDLENGARVTYV